MMRVSAVALALTTVVVVTCLVLANWQWQRAQQKQERLDHIQAMQGKGALLWSDLELLPPSLNKTGLQLQLTGQFETQRYWLLDNRTLQGRPGFDLLVAFYPDESHEGDHEALLVNLGWITQGLSRQVLPEITLPAETVTLTVQLKEGDLTGFYLAEANQVKQGWPKLIQYIAMQELQAQSGIELKAFMAYATQASGQLLGIAQPHYQPVVMPPEKHRAYAWQWLFIGLAAATVFTVAMRQQGAAQRIASKGESQ